MHALIEFLGISCPISCRAWYKGMLTPYSPTAQSKCDVTLAANQIVRTVRLQLNGGS